MYRYRCEQCATTSPAVRTRVEVEGERDRHRRAVHGGHIPDGERLQRWSAGTAARDRKTLFWLALLVVLLVASAVLH